MGETDSELAWRQHLYLQTRLKEKNGRIRLLTIQPRQYTASRPEAPPNTIHCFLRLAELKEHPQFTVVSHRWQATDAADEAKSLLVNGAPVPTSTGLFEVLHNIQRESDPVVVWIDALCINHADENEREKSVQVSQLAQIYATAEKTLIWLGAAADRSDEAMKVLRRLAEEQLTLSAYVANWTPQLGHQLAQKILPSRFLGAGPTASPGNKEPLELQKELESLRAPLKALMERDYWTDLWSLVELCLSHKGLIVCGSHGLPLDHFYSAARALDHIINHLTYSKWLASATSPATPSAQKSTALSVDEVSNLSQSPALRVLGRREGHRRDADSWLKSPDNPLFALLSRFYAVPAANQLPLRVGDARDRVYALACLATDTAELGLAVDYAKDVNQVYAETSAAFLQRHPRVLQLARGTLSAGDGLTSWAVDWENVRVPPSYLGASSPERPFNACGPADIRYYRADNTGASSSQISLKAAVVDSVQEVGAAYAPGDDDDAEEQQRAYLSEIRRFWEDSTASISSPYFAEQAAVALAKIPVGDIEGRATASNAFARASSATIEGYRRTAEALFPAETAGDEEPAAQQEEDKEKEGQEGQEPKPKPAPPAPDAPYLAAMARMAGRRPFRSQNGYVGLGPADLGTADVVGIPYGSPVPFAFRPVAVAEKEEEETDKTSEGESEGEGALYRLVGEVYVFGIMDGEFMKVHRQETVLRVI